MYKSSKWRLWRWRDGVKEESSRGQNSEDQVETDALISRLRNARSCTCAHVCLMALISWSVRWNTEENQQSGISIKVNNHPPSSLRLSSLSFLSSLILSSWVFWSVEEKRKWEKRDSEWEWGSKDAQEDRVTLFNQTSSSKCHQLY